MKSVEDYFDAVVMLTGSNWKTEPRSNRYHYATRFARSVPVLFVQPWETPGTPIVVEPTELSNVEIVHGPMSFQPDDVDRFRALLRSRGYRRILFWIYDAIHYQPLIDAFPGSFRIFHATEDYLTRTSASSINYERLEQSLRRLLSDVDLLIGVSERVTETYVESGLFTGKTAVIPNGCDAAFFFENGADIGRKRNKPGNPVAIFQGGINRRLDYKLLFKVIRGMPDWNFQFCGAVSDSAGWRRVRELANVSHLGVLPPHELARRLSEATVGIIPFIQDRWIRNSWPLKAYEYVACGLPVVTVPIDALEGKSELFAFASTANAFQAAIRAAAPTRTGKSFLNKRRIAAEANSYDRRFSDMTRILFSELERLAAGDTQLRAAILYCPRSTHIATVREYLESFGRFSRNQVFYIPASINTCKYEKNQIDFSSFDVLILHYSIRICLPEHFDAVLANAFERFRGLKVLFIQDEYENVETARRWMDRLQFDVVYTVLPPESIGQIYPPDRFPSTEFLPILTGYVPEAGGLERFAKPLSDRKVLLAYRGRKLSAAYGELGHEKYRIGVQMKEAALQRGFPVDIEVDDNKRIYGARWYEFLGSARATLATESGSNVFDIDGSLRKKIKKFEEAHPDMTFVEVSARFLVSREGSISVNQISPKMFEAILLRTALVMFEGSYSGILRPDEHFIPLKKDFSNVDDVLDKIQDDQFIKDLTDRAYRDIVGSGKYSYESFVRRVDADLGARVRHRSNYRLYTTALAVAPDGSMQQAWPLLPSGVTTTKWGTDYLNLDNSTIFKEDCGPRETAQAPIPDRPRITPVRTPLPLELRTLLFRISRFMWHQIPTGLRYRLVRLVERR